MVAATKEPSTALAVVPRKLELVQPIAPVEEILQAKRRMLELIPKLLKPGVDFVKIPGTDRECLSKAGAEAICGTFGAHPEYEIVTSEIDHDRVNVFASRWVETDEKPSKGDAARLKAEGKGRWRKNQDGTFTWMVRGEGEGKSYGLYRFIFRCRIVRQDGLILGESFGSCSTLEAKYIDRPRDCENTIIKMGQKRSHVGAALNAFSLSDRFTADVDDVAGEVDEHPKSNDGIVDAEYETGDARGEEKPKGPAAQNVRAEVEKAKASVAAQEEEAKKKAAAAALSWAKGFLDKLDKAAVLPKDADDDLKKGALEAFSTVLDENEAPLKALATQAPKLHFAVSAYSSVLAGHLHGTEVPIEERDRAALDWLHAQRGPATTTTAA